MFIDRVFLPRRRTAALRGMAAVLLGISLIALNTCLGGGGNNDQTGGNGPTQNSQGVVVKNAFGFDIHDPINHWPSVPFTYWRIWDSTVDWPRVETARGVYDWSRLDQYVALGQQHNVKMVYVLGNTPQWAATNPQSPSNEVLPGASSTLKNVQDWGNFVQAVVTRYKGQIQAYEIWNESDLLGYWTGTIADMLQMTQIAYTTIKQVDPSATVLAPSLVAGNGLVWLQQYMAAGGDKYTDAIAYHLYTTDLAPENALTFQKAILAVAQQYNKPEWDTEVGFGPWGTFNDQESAAYLARVFILQTSLGISHIMWYAWDDRGPWVHLYMVQPDLTTPTLAATAFTQVSNWLQSATVSCTNDQTDLSWQCTLNEADGSTKYVVWNPITPETFTIPSSWQVGQVQDLTGNTTAISGGQVTISASPVLLEP